MCRLHIDVFLSIYVFWVTLLNGLKICPVTFKTWETLVNSLFHECFQLLFFKAGWVHDSRILSSTLNANNQPKTMLYNLRQMPAWHWTWQLLHTCILMYTLLFILNYNVYDKQVSIPVSMPLKIHTFMVALYSSCVIKFSTGKTTMVFESSKPEQFKAAKCLKCKLSQSPSYRLGNTVALQLSPVPLQSPTSSRTC